VKNVSKLLPAVYPFSMKSDCAAETANIAGFWSNTTPFEMSGERSFGGMGPLLTSRLGSRLRREREKRISHYERKSFAPRCSRKS
jgi:hypothetical protein